MNEFIILPWSISLSAALSSFCNCGFGQYMSFRVLIIWLLVLLWLLTLYTIKTLFFGQKEEVTTNVTILVSVPEAAKEPHSMIEPQPFFTVGRVFLSSWATFQCLYTNGCTEFPKNSTLVSTVHRTLSHKDCSLPIYVFTNITLTFCAFSSVPVSSLAFTYRALIGVACSVWYRLKPPLQIHPGQPEAL